VIDITTPPKPSPLSAKQGPITHACARELYHQVNLFLADQTNYFLNGVILKPCDNFIILRFLEIEPARRSGERNNAMKAARPQGILVTAESTSLNGTYISTPKAN
jgi:hypothetical protein